MGKRNNKNKTHYRSNFFYYIEVYTKPMLRKKKLNEVLGKKNIKPKYYNGVYGKLDKKNKIYLTIFWKQKKTAESRIKSLFKFEDLYFQIVEINRLEFIKTIPDKVPGSLNKWDRGNYLMNLDKKIEEENYMNALKCRKLKEL